MNKLKFELPPHLVTGFSPLGLFSLSRLERSDLVVKKLDNNNEVESIIDKLNYSHCKQDIQAGKLHWAKFRRRWEIKIVFPNFFVFFVDTTPV